MAALELEPEAPPARWLEVDARHVPGVIAGRSR